MLISLDGTITSTGIVCKLWPALSNFLLPTKSPAKKVTNLNGQLIRVALIIPLFLLGVNIQGVYILNYCTHRNFHFVILTMRERVIMNREQFAANFRDILNKSKYDVYDVAAAVNREPRSIRGYINGKHIPTVNVLNLLCNLLLISPNEILRNCYSIDPVYQAEQIYTQIIPEAKVTAIINYFYAQSLNESGTADIGNRIRVIMREDSIDISGLAEAIHFSIRTTKNILYDGVESMPSLDTLIAICEYLNTSPHYLLQDELLHSNEVVTITKLRCLTPTQLKLIYELL